MEVNLREDAIEVLDSYIFEDIQNNNNFSEDEWDITWEGFEFLLRHRESGELFNFRVTYQPGTLTEEDKKRLGDDQEWWDDDE